MSKGSVNNTKDGWGSSWGFVMATAGSAVGLGSLWRFPYIAGENGGGLFVLIYIFFIVIVGFPLFLTEIVVGKKTKHSALLAFGSLLGDSTKYRWIGWFGFASAAMVTAYYFTASSWCLSYILMTVTGSLQNRSLLEIGSVFDLLSSSPGINIFWLCIFLFINVGVVYTGIHKGIEACSKLLMPLLFVTLLIFCIYGATLSGFKEALYFTFYPDLQKLSRHGVLDALGMALFTLSLGLGILVTYGSYMVKQEGRVLSSGIMVVIINVVVSLLASMTIFPIVFTFGFPTEGGPGLVFKTMPVLFAQLPLPMLVSFLFFSLLFFAALTSTISLFESMVNAMIDHFKWSRKYAIMIVAVIIAFISLPSVFSESEMLDVWKEVYNRSLFDTISYLVTSWMIPVTALSIALFVGWKVPKKLLVGHISDNYLVGLYWWLSLKYLAPVAIICVMMYEIGIF